MTIMVFSQELWLSPQRFFFTIRDIANLRFLLGENLAGTEWRGNNDSIAHLVLYSPGGGTKNLIPVVRDGNMGLQLSLREEGTHMVVFHSRNTRSDYDAKNFNQYLQDEGLNQVIDFRRQHGEEQEMTSLQTQHCVKTIFQVGGLITDECRYPSLLPLEILPEENPYSVPQGSYNDKPVKRRFQVLFYGQPLNNVLVKITYRGTGNSIHTDSSRSNRKGWISIERHTGPTLLTTTYMERNQRDTSARWQAYKTSLSFEYSRFFPGKTGR
jgi:hypothetical protein